MCIVDADLGADAKRSPKKENLKHRTLNPKLCTSEADAKAEVEQEAPKATDEGVVGFGRFRVSGLGSKGFGVLGFQFLEGGFM